MSKLAKISFLSAIAIVAVVAVVQILTQMPWINLFTVAMYVAGCIALAGIAVDYKFYLEVLSMRTTKHGLNMGATILLTLVILICVNYLANRHGKTWDFTQEKLNSLSDQSVNLTKGLKEDVQITVFNSKQAPPQVVSGIKNTLGMFADNSSRFRVRYLNQYADPATASEYLSGLQDQGTEQTFVFAELGGKRVRIEQPFDEAAVAAALIRLTRSGEAKVYFLTGHGEKDIHGEMGIRDFVKSLEESSVRVESLNLLERREIPKDAGALAIVGPSVQYLDEELKMLREYAENGGRLFIALDPGQRSNLTGLIKSMGVEFENNYVVMPSPQYAGAGTATITGNTFDSVSDVTKSLGGADAYTAFTLASELKAAPDKAKDIKVSELVKSNKYGFTMADLKDKIRGTPDFRQVTVAMEARGKLDEKASKSFWAVIFGDSDFITNRELAMGLNRDLGMNAIAALTEQKDLISIRPKMPAGTMIVMTTAAGWGVVILCILLPLSLLITGGVIWFRRRGA